MEKHSCAFYLYFAVMLVVIVLMEHFVLIPSLVTPVASSIEKFNFTISSSIRTRTIARGLSFVEPPDVSEKDRFTVIIVTFNEALLNKTYKIVRMVDL